MIGLSKRNLSSEVGTPKDSVLQRGLSSYLAYALLLLVIVFFATIRYRLRDIPLERDEGEFAYGGQLILQGFPLYQHLYTMKLPGVFAAYALILAVFGQTIAGVHLGLLLVNAATTFLVFLLSKRMFGSLAGLIAGASYALLSTSPSILGFAGHATHFVVLPAIGGAFLLLSAIEKWEQPRYFGSGLLFGLAFLMKQPGIAFAFFGGTYLAYTQWHSRSRSWRKFVVKSLCYVTGVMLPFAVTCLVMVASKSFDKFWFWTFRYARQYGTLQTLAQGIEMLRLMLPTVTRHVLGMWVLAIAGLIAAARNRTARKYFFFLLSFLCWSLLAVCAGLYFRQHYFILLLPVAALLVGVAISSATEAMMQATRVRHLSFLPVLIFVSLFAYSIYAQRSYFFEMAPRTASRTVYGLNPFLEAVQVAAYIRSHTAPGTSIAVLGSEPEIYFYADRPSATGYVYTYGLMEDEPYARRMQHEMSREIEALGPKYIVFVNVPWSFGRLPTSDPFIFHWIDSYLSNYYAAMGVVDISDHDHAVWGEAAKNYVPHSNVFINVFERR